MAAVKLAFSFKTTVRLLIFIYCINFCDQPHSYCYTNGSQPYIKWGKPVTYSKSLSYLSSRPKGAVIKFTFIQTKHTRHFFV